MLASEILQCGAESQIIADEIYVQMCKHATENHDINSLRHIWQLMSMSISSFAPSSEFEVYWQHNINSYVINAYSYYLYSYINFCLLLYRIIY